MATLSKLYSMREAAEHNTREDCWVVIDGKVYDVTSYLDEHPGGDDVLLSAAGRDSTEDFEEVGHSNDARELMQAYCVGELDPDHAVIPELEVFRKDQSSGFTNKLKNITFEYWAATAVIGIAVVAGILYSRKS
ncbi:cytochrome b5-like [Zingiber officinale]|nr:cytochrome b5-like [Zingiber officinale]